MAKALEQLDQTQIHADFDGVVTAVEAEIGQVVQPGQTVMTIARPDVREAVVDMPAEINGRLKPGARFDIVLQLDPTIRAVGVVREIAPQADSATRTRRVWISLDNPPASFRLGTTITAVPAIASLPQIELPASALLERNGKLLVWVVDPNMTAVSLREVKIGVRDARSFQVVEGLPLGVRVVVAGVNSLTPGQTVKIPDEAIQ